MSEAVETSSYTESGRRFEASTIVQAIIGIALVALAFVALAASDESTQGSLRLWSVVIVVYCIAALIIDGVYRSTYEPLWRDALRTIVHWIGVLAAVNLLYFFVAAGRMANADVSLSAALILGLGAFASGVHGNWRFVVIGTAVALGAAAAAWIEQYLWALAGLGLVSFILLLVGITRRKKAAAD